MLGCNKYKVKYNITKELLEEKVKLGLSNTEMETKEKLVLDIKNYDSGFIKSN